jgi:transposase
LRNSAPIFAWSTNIQHRPNVNAFYEKLVAARKKPMQAVVAVMRKLLHAIWGMLKHAQDFDGNKFFKLTKLTERTP